MSLLFIAFFIKTSRLLKKESLGSSTKGSSSAVMTGFMTLLI